MKVEKKNKWYLSPHKLTHIHPLSHTYTHTHRCKATHPPTYKKYTQPCTSYMFDSVSVFCQSSLPSTVTASYHSTRASLRCCCMHLVNSLCIQEGRMGIGEGHDRGGTSSTPIGCVCFAGLSIISGMWKCTGTCTQHAYLRNTITCTHHTTRIPQKHQHIPNNPCFSPLLSLF